MANYTLVNAGDVNSIALADNTIGRYYGDFIDTKSAEEVRNKIDLNKYVDPSIAKYTTLVVVDQIPKPGEEVPLGTPVSLVFIPKDEFGVADVAGLDVSIAEKYGGKKFKDVIADVDKSEQAVDVIKAKKEYGELSDAEKKAVKDFAVSNGLADETATDEKVEKIYQDIAFIYNL